ncbi:MBL fold metallo-hydrolase [Formosa sediminum]|uniref:MBL fold metallo-hydrolase n=1 Tax=Formosa sediminum TaxID=2594004 RepID=A0A516GTA4_9FLAO|nr:MBL fold metallo-hydrolase [Formosa sediminum]QDO94745.1 MBL fold metallo-hydrolase [Formosa sediminum]
MKKIFFIAVLLSSITTYSFNTSYKGYLVPKLDTTLIKQNTKITPISHATFIMKMKNIVIYFDPVGGAEAFKGQDTPNLILITDIHGDHLNIETLEAVTQQATTIIAPQAVADKLTPDLKKQTLIIKNGETTTYEDIKIEAIPMYNLRDEALKFHAKGRGNGYLLSQSDTRIYISGDTEDIPEMRNLKNIDLAFVCMNLPYTMPVKNAADAVLDFKPKEVIPYHYRGTDGLSDINYFKSLIEAKNKTIKVTLLDWYSKN